MRGLGKVKIKVLRKPLDLVKKVLPKSRRQRSQEQTPAVAAAEPNGAEGGSSSSLNHRARTHNAAEAEPRLRTTTTTVTSTASSKSNITTLSSMLPSRSAAAKSTDGVGAADPPEACPICQDPVGLPNPEGVVEAWTSLRCGHRFGTVCIQTWLQDTLNRDQNSTPSCPCCRAAAKHPGCGHHVCPPSVHNHIWAQYHMRLQIAHSEERLRQGGGRPQRRRLQRRSGHPSIPSPPRREAETVGDCARCKVHEARLKQHQQQFGHAPAAASGHRETGSLLAGKATQRIKSYFPLQSVQPAHDGPPESLVRTSVRRDPESGEIRMPPDSDAQWLAAAQGRPTPVPEPTYASPRRGSV